MSALKWPVVPLAVTLITLVTFAMGTKQAISINSDQSIVAGAPVAASASASATVSKSEISSTVSQQPTLMNISGGAFIDSVGDSGDTTQVTKSSIPSTATVTTSASSIGPSTTTTAKTAQPSTSTIRKSQQLQSTNGKQQQSSSSLSSSSSSSSNGRARRPQAATVRSLASNNRPPSSTTTDADNHGHQPRVTATATATATATTAATNNSELGYDPMQDEIRRLMAEYKSTPPLWVTATRDFFVDVARYPLGFKLTTMQAIDNEGDPIEYSLKPSTCRNRDALPYFSINSTSGELRLANKRIPALYSSLDIDGGGGGGVGGESLLASNADHDDDDDDTTSDNNGGGGGVEDGSSGVASAKSNRQQQQQLARSEDSVAEKPGYLYCLNVVAYDGKYPSTIELHIHAFNSTSFGTKSPVRLTIEGGRHTGEQLMRAKTNEFFDKLYSPLSSTATPSPSTSSQVLRTTSDSSYSNSTLVFPSFINPGLIAPNSRKENGNEDNNNNNDGDNDDDNGDDGNEQFATSPTASLSPPTIRAPDSPMQSARAYQLANKLAPPSSSSSSSLLPASLSFVEQTAHLDSGSSSSSSSNLNGRHADGVLHQPMMLSLVIIICSCFTIALVLLIFVVPLSVKRLKKRLKNMEMQHEQLSQKASNGGSSIVCSSSSTSGRSMTISSSSGTSCHLPSLSQFTLASSGRVGQLQQMAASSASNQQHRLPLGRQSSLDSAITSNHFISQMSPPSASSYNSQSAQAYQQHTRANMHPQALMDDSAFNFQPTTNHHFIHHQQQQQQQLQSNCLNRINNGAIVNPVYLHQLQRDHNNGATSRSISVPDGDNIYCPIDDEFYSTINTESTTVGMSGNNTGNNYAPPLVPGNQVPLSGSNQQHQQLHHHHHLNMIGSLEGQTFDSRNYFAAQCAPQQRNEGGGGGGLAISGGDQRDTDTPNSIGSRSSTRSLARFLSLPARHWSHQKQRDTDLSDKRSVHQHGTSFLDELEYHFKETATAASDHQVQANKSTAIGDNLALNSASKGNACQTIARANHIAQEQQVCKNVRNTNNNNNNSNNKRLKSSVSVNLGQRQQPQQHVWELERHKLKFLNILDEGQFGLVWRCKLRTTEAGCDTDSNDSWTLKGTEQTVAVKTLKNIVAKDEREREELLAEIEIMKLVCNHPNVVKILHCCTRDIGQSKPILLVMEHVELGKLQSFLEKSRASHNYATTTTTAAAASGLNMRDYRAVTAAAAAASDAYYCDDESTTVYGGVGGGDNDNESRMQLNQQQQQQHRCQLQDQLTSRELIKFIYHVAKGMEYISSQLLVHRDLASRNILISSQRICKIGDFGMARQMGNQGDVYERHSRNTKIPVRWMAPEVLLNNSFTIKSDVYSFGILMWEIVTLGSTPYRHLKTEQIVEAVAKLGERPNRPDYCHALLYSIMSRCWSATPSERPTFGQLVAQLDELLLSTNEYIELDQYPDHNYYNIDQTAAPLELL